MKGRGLGLGGEVRAGREHARAKRWRIAHRLYVDFDWPHGQRPQRSWKAHRKTPWRRVPASAG